VVFFGAQKELTGEHTTEASDDALRDPLVGSPFAERYRILGRIGQGGMSVVYKARHVLMRKLVAVKMLQAHQLGSGIAVRRFQQESQAVSAMDHPNIVHVDDFGVSDSGQPFLVMDFLEGASLADLIEKAGCIPVDRALHIFIQVAGALAHAHDRGIIHRDLKPSNIMLVKHDADEDFVKIVDFGIAKLLPQEGEDYHKLTQTGEVFGSPLYMSPEQCTGVGLDARSDIYSLGCVMYEALTGQPPLKGSTPIATINMQMSDMPPPLAIPRCDPRLAAHLDAVVFKAMDKDPARRYQSMSELRQDLLEIQSNAAAGHLSAPLRSRAFQWARRGVLWARAHPVKVMLAVAPLLALLALILTAVLVVAPLVAPLPVVKTDIAWKDPSVPARSVPPDFDGTERTLLDLLERTKGANGSHSPELIYRLDIVARLYESAGLWEKAAFYFGWKLDIEAKHDGEDSQPYADDAQRWADCYFNANRFDLAARMVRAYGMAMKTYGRLWGTTPGSDISVPHLISIYSRLGQVFEFGGNPGQAALYLNHAVSLCNSSHSDVQCLVALSHLGDVLRKLCDVEHSDRAYQLALAQWSKVEGGDFNAALCRYHLGQNAAGRGKFAEAVLYYQKALPVFESTWGANDPRLYGVLADYSNALKRDNRWLDGLLMASRARHLVQSAT